MAHPAELEAQGVPTGKRDQEYPLDGDRPLIHMFHNAQDPATSEAMCNICDSDFYSKKVYIKVTKIL